MTQLDVLYRFGVPPTESSIVALGKIREVYGIRHLAVDERARTIRVEYDATRLTEASVHKLLRGAGLDITELVPLAVAPPPPEPLPDAPPVA